jgi:hypothetical protein
MVTLAPRAVSLEDEIEVAVEIDVRGHEHARTGRGFTSQDDGADVRLEDERPTRLEFQRALFLEVGPGRGGDAKHQAQGGDNPRALYHE